MKKILMITIVLFSIIAPFSCAQGRTGVGDVTQVEFASSGKYLVVVNENRLFQPKDCNCRLRTYTVSDWKLIADSGKMSLKKLQLAASEGDTWALQAKGLNSAGGNPYTGPVFQTLSPIRLKRTDVDVMKMGAENWFFVPSAIACSTAKSLCALHVTSSNNGPQHAFIFDLGKQMKTVEFDDFPSGQHVPPPPFDDSKNGFTVMNTVLEFTPDGKFVASSHPSKPYKIQLYGADSGKLIRSLNTTSPIGAMRFSPSGKFLAALCWDGQVLIIESDLSRVANKVAVKGYQVCPHDLAFGGNNWLAVISGSNKVEIFGTKEWKSTGPFDWEGKKINCVAASPDGELLVMGFGEGSRVPGKVRVLEIKTGKLIAELD
jgi:WD40 repeat protein